MEQHLKRVLNLVRRTGDTMVVVDKDGSDAFVVMDLDRYEHLLDETSFFDEEIDDFSQESIPSEIQESESTIWDVMQTTDGEGETWNLDKLSEEELSDLEKNYKEFAARHETIKQNESNKSDVEHPEKEKEIENQQKKNDEEYGEEQFYLEPIE
ncbi:MAG: hypothetical protein UT30_C0019G0004 [Candidatus Uhrbacteria bacterium GW2011_GWF2_39_13]|uniref:Antitoxin n=1 Tax=Candidatus Uhrbacteria bacterium GW2011_GWF2_39_13 TaxID=1618995 RepID=A0A0G0MKV3_9BACT|nr:MAG: hypothetical protein UT30_C0019G0004 [Candidatus Uhrbacteria bacterium GW2011_GWF2_39_13]